MALSVSERFDLMSGLVCYTEDCHDNICTASQRTCHFIFCYNSCVSWLLFIIFVLLVVGMNTLQPLIIYLPNSLMMS